MFLVEKISNKIGNTISTSLKMDNDQEEIIIYGAFNFLQTLWSILIIMLFGFIFSVFFEALIISFTGSFLRRYSGGVHATSPNRCVAIGTFICTVLALFIVYVLSDVNFLFIAFLFFISLIYSYYIIYKLAPVDSRAKPIVNIAKKQHLKRCSIIILSTLYLLITILYLLYNSFGTISLLEYGLCINLAIIWQSFTLTPSGHNLINKVDAVLNFYKKEVT